MRLLMRWGAPALLALPLVVGGAFGMIPQQEPGVVERAAGKLDAAGRQIKEGFERGFGTARDAAARKIPSSWPRDARSDGQTRSDLRR